MQDFSQADFNNTKAEIKRFETLIKQNSKSYFDVDQIESIFDYYNESNMYDKAEIALDMGLHQHPDSTTLKLKYSTILIEKNKYEESLDILTYLEKIESNNAEIYLNMGIIHAHKKDKIEAIKYFEKSLKHLSEEDLCDYIFEMSFTLNQQSYFNEVKNLLNYYKKDIGENENILFELAYAYDKLNDIEKGIGVYKQLLDINPFSDTAWYNLGILNNKLDLTDKAIEAYDMAISISANLSEAYYNKANSLTQIGKYKEALNSYAEYISLTHFSSNVCYYMGDCWENIGDQNMAKNFYKLASNLDIENIDALEALSRVAYETQDFITSIKAIEQILTITPNSSEQWLSLGKNHIKNKNNNEAKECFKKALTNNPESTHAWIEMYELMDVCETNFDAISFIEDLLIEDNDNGALHYLAAIIYNKNNDNKQSLSHLIIARQLLSNNLDYVLDKYPLLTSIPEINNTFRHITDN